MGINKSLKHDRLSGNKRQHKINPIIARKTRVFGVSQKSESCHDANFVVTGGTGGSRQWRQSRHHNNSWILVYKLQRWRGVVCGDSASSPGPSRRAGWPSSDLTDHIPSESHLSHVFPVWLRSYVLSCSSRASHMIYLGAATDIWNNLPQFPISCTLHKMTRLSMPPLNNHRLSIN